MSSQARTMADFVSGTTTITGTPTFTGTVAGAGSMEAISTTNITTPASSVTFDNLSTDYDIFRCIFELHPSTDNVQMDLQFLDAAGSAITGGTSYGNYADFDGTAITADDASTIPLSASNLGNDTHEGLRGSFELLGRNYAVATDVVAPCITGINIGHYNSNVFSGGAVIGGLNSSQIQTIRGFIIKVSSGNIERGKIYLFGIRNE